MSLLEEALDENYFEGEWSSTQYPELDWWAIKVCVREGKYMNLTRPEQAVACKLMRRKEMSFDLIADILHLDPAVARGLVRPDRRVIDLDVVIEELPNIIGGKVIDEKAILDRKTTKRLVGR